MTVWFAARRIRPAAIGGIEAWSREVREVLDTRFDMQDVSHAGAKWSEPAYLARLRTLRTQPGDVIDASDAATVIGLPSNNQIIARAHGLDLIHSSRVYQQLLRRNIGKVDTWVANSHATADLLKKQDVPGSVHVVHPPALGSYSPGFQDGILLMVGRLVERKGFADFVRNVWPTIEGMQLHIVGDGPERPRLEKAMSQVEGVHWHGQLPGPALEQLWQRADVLAVPNQRLPHDHEGFGMVAAEAAVRGVPVIANAVDGLVDAVVHGKTGALLGEGGWAEAIARWRGLSEPNRQALADFADQRWGADRHATEYGNLVASVLPAGK